MSSTNENVLPTDLSRSLGERGDYVACKTTEIGSAVKNGAVEEDDVEELQEALAEIGELLERATIVATRARRSPASAD